MVCMVPKFAFVIVLGPQIVWNSWCTATYFLPLWNCQQWLSHLTSSINFIYIIWSQRNPHMISLVPWDIWQIMHSHKECQSVTWQKCYGYWFTISYAGSFITVSPCHASVASSDCNQVTRTGTWNRQVHAPMTSWQFDHLLSHLSSSKLQHGGWVGKDTHWVAFSTLPFYVTLKV